MSNRLELQTLLEGVLGSRNVYYQPPASVVIKYPCMVYNRSNIQSIYADNSPYNFHVRYDLTVIDKDPDSVIPINVLKLSMCRFDRHYTKDNLNHDVFNIYY